MGYGQPSAGRSYPYIAYPHVPGESPAWLKSPAPALVYRTQLYSGSGTYIYVGAPPKVAVYA